MSIGSLASALLLFPALAVAGPLETEVKALIAKRVAQDPRLVGLVIAVSQGSDQAVVGWGRLGAAGTPAPDGDTVFEIGSVTKVFTARLLADVVDRRLAKLDDPAESLLSNGGRLPRSPSGKTFTLRQLAEHSSGLPRLPDDFSPADPADPYVDYTEARLDAFLKTHVLSREPGEKREYSNLGYGLLGGLLSLKAGMDYPSLLQDRIAGPLGMTRTAVSWSGPMAQGHDLSGDPVPHWDLGAFVGAGALRSTAHDLLKFLAAEAAKPGKPLGWQDDGFLWHNGQTGGFHSSIGFDRASGRRVVVLSNAAVDSDDIAAHLLDASRRLDVPPSARRTVVVAPALLDAYAGRYELEPGFIITIRREGERLKAQATGQPEFPIFAESDTDFYFKVVEASLTFHRDVGGRVTHLTLHQGGDKDARRLP
ncbi:MAG: serine hydrolase [Elusimicrobiota bacterium]|mgnify:CR=1 FL=1